MKRMLNWLRGLFCVEEAPEEMRPACECIGAQIRAARGISSKCEFCGCVVLCAADMDKYRSDKDGRE